jgi:hypothetical protein
MIPQRLNLYQYEEISQDLPAKYYYFAAPSVEAIRVPKPENAKLLIEDIEVYSNNGKAYQTYVGLVELCKITGQTYEFDFTRNDREGMQSYRRPLEDLELFSPLFTMYACDCGHTGKFAEENFGKRYKSHYMFMFFGTTY